MQNTRLEHHFFFTVFLGILALTFFLFLPFLGALSVALVFAVIFFPLHRHIVHAVRFKGLAALLSTVLILLIVFVPLSAVGYVLFGQAQDLFTQLSQGEGDTAAVLGYIESTINRVAPGFELDVSAYAKQGLQWLTQSIGSIFASTAGAVLTFVIGVIALFYFFRDGERLRQALVEYSPLRDEYDNEVIEKVRRAINSIIRGAILVAIIQGILSGIGFTIFGLPHAALWGSIAALGALIPGVGTAIVLIPAIAYLAIVAGAAPALGLLAWGVIAVGLVDNLLGPYLIGRGTKLHPLLILLAVLGGLQFFGPVGFLLGPIVLALLLALVEVYQVLTKQAAPRQ